MPTSSQPDDVVDGAGWGAVGTDDGGGEAVDGPLEDALVVVAKLSLGTSVIINWLKYSLKSSMTIMWKPDLKVMHPLPSGILTSRLTTLDVSQEGLDLLAQVLDVDIIPDEVQHESVPNAHFQWFFLTPPMHLAEGKGTCMHLHTLIKGL